MIKRTKFWKRVLCGLLLFLSLTGVSTAMADTKAETPRYELSDTMITKKTSSSGRVYTMIKEKESSKGRVLIYHTHTQEDYVDSNVVEMGLDLATKLEKKGFVVDHVSTDFVRGDYNNAYNYSREYLKSIDLTQYSLVIDYHRDALAYPNTVPFKGNNVAKGMMVFSKQSRYFEDSERISNGILGYMDNFDRGLTRDNWYYDYGINDFNSDLNNNIILWESGNNSNSKLEIMRLNTYFASAIDQYLSR